MIRRKFALRIYWERYRSRLLTVVIPWFQACVRGYLQRARFRIVKQQLHRIRMATKIANAYRRHIARQRRLAQQKSLRLASLILRSVGLIQRVYRASAGRLRLQRRRNLLANQRLQQAKTQARLELTAIKIQRVFRGHVARELCARILEERRRLEELRRLRERAARLIQRVAKGRSGRKRAVLRRNELLWMEKKWRSALVIEREWD